MEEVITFDSEGNSLIGVLHSANKNEKLGVLLVVGGPQTRVGSHRQFVLLARYLSEHKVPVLRFDYHGMGDSSGELSSFEDCERDIKHAIDAFYESVPELTGVVLWGLCDAAAASVFYAPQDSRVKGLVLLNPWARTEGGEAKAFVKHYYLSRLVDKNLWKKVFSGKFELGKSVSSLFSNLNKTFSSSAPKANGVSKSKSLFDPSTPLPERLYKGLSQFNGSILFVISGDDLTAAEFLDVAESSADWKSLMRSAKITKKTLQGANHTFSSKAWRAQVEHWTLDWIGEQNV